MTSEKNKRELRNKLAVLVAARFGGDYRAAFGLYADRDGKVDRKGVKALLPSRVTGRRSYSRRECGESQVQLVVRRCLLSTVRVQQLGTNYGIRRLKR